MQTKTHRNPDFLSGRFTKPLMQSAQNVWLASLGALSMAQKESSRLMEQGSDLFDRLASEGEKFEKRAMKTARAEAAGAGKNVRKALGLQKQPVVYHLLPRGEGWTVRLEGNDEKLSVHATKEEALDAARGVAHAHMPSRLVVHRADGTIQTSYTYE